MSVAEKNEILLDALDRMLELFDTTDPDEPVLIADSDEIADAIVNAYDVINSPDDEDSL